MGKAKKPKPELARAAEKKRGKSEAPWRSAGACAIWFPDEEAHLRAIMVLGEVGVLYVSVPGPKGEALYGVTRAAAKSLRIEAGALRKGMPADFVVLGIESPEEFGWQSGGNLARAVFRKGELVA